MITTTGGPEPEGVKVVVPGVKPGVNRVVGSSGGVVTTTTGGPEPDGVKVVVPGVGPVVNEVIGLPGAVVTTTIGGPEPDGVKVVVPGVDPVVNDVIGSLGTVVISTTGGPEPEGVKVVVPGVGPVVNDVTGPPGTVVTMTTGGPEGGVKVVVPGVDLVVNEVIGCPGTLVTTTVHGSVPEADIVTVPGTEPLTVFVTVFVLFRYRVSIIFILLSRFILLYGGNFFCTCHCCSTKSTGDDLRRNFSNRNSETINDYSRLGGTIRADINGVDRNFFSCCNHRFRKIWWTLIWCHYSRWLGNNLC